MKGSRDGVNRRPRHMARAPESLPGDKHKPERQSQRFDASSRYNEDTLTARKLAARLWRRPQHYHAMAVVATRSRFHGAMPSMVDKRDFKGKASNYFDYNAEAVTVWNPTQDNTWQIGSSTETLALKYELQQARARIRELEENRCCCSNKELIHQLWRAGVEYGTSKTMERANSKLVKELADAKSSLEWLVRCYEAERKKRELPRNIRNTVQSLLNDWEKYAPEIEQVLISSPASIIKALHTINISQAERPVKSSRSSMSTTRDRRSVSLEIELKDICYQKF